MKTKLVSNNNVLLFYSTEARKECLKKNTTVTFFDIMTVIYLKKRVAYTIYTSLTFNEIFKWNLFFIPNNL